MNLSRGGHAGTRFSFANARELGVRVKIITGDAQEVAGWVGFSAGILTNPREVITGDELDKLSPDEKLAAVERYHVFARTASCAWNDVAHFFYRTHHDFSPVHSDGARIYPPHPRGNAFRSSRTRTRRWLFCHY